MAEKPSDQMWQAIVECDPAFDREFYYGVATTRIFCRPSCKSRTPSRDNVVVFRRAEEALALRFRPCKRCRPNGLRLPDEEWTSEIADWMAAHYGEAVTLDRLAEEFHASPYHLQRTFKRIKGMTPAACLLGIRMEQARRLLAEVELPVSEISARVGFPSAAHFSVMFVKTTGVTPTLYRRRARGEEGNAR